MTVSILTGDCRELMADQGPFDMIIADPPYGDTSLEWDRRVFGWTKVALERLKPTGSLWLFGSMRFLLHLGSPAGFRFAQDIVWEKHNGSGFAADRFKRVHEHALQFYRADSQWESVWNEVQTTPDAAPRITRRKRRPTHTGNIAASAYVSEDGGPRLMRSVIYMPSMHGRAIHPTEKPSMLVERRMNPQQDLFSPPTRAPWKAEDDYPRWEAGLLADLAERPLVACYPGFAGAMLEALVERGHAAREDAGFMDPEAGNISDEIRATKAFKAHVRAYWKDPSPMFRFTITDAGRALLSAREAK